MPGCIGAERTDRLPRYFWRSLLITCVLSTPIVALQFGSEAISRAVGVPAVNAAGVGRYCRLMIANTWLTVLDTHLQIVLLNLRYVKLAMLTGAHEGSFWTKDFFGGACGARHSRAHTIFFKLSLRSRPQVM